MLRFFCLTLALSTTLISSIAQSTVSKQPSKIPLHLLISDANNDTPACYMQTPDGTTVDLTSICGKEPRNPARPPAVTCPQITDPERRALFAQSCGNNAECLANLGCQQPPKPLFLPLDGSTPG